MKRKFLLLVCVFLCLAACHSPAVLEPAPTEPAPRATEPATAATEPVTAPAEPETEKPTEPEPEPETDPPTEATTAPQTEAPADPTPPVYDSTDHPVHGEMSMTYEERDYTLRVDNREVDILGGLKDDPRYPDICGGFAYRGGMLYIFSLDDGAVDALVRASLAIEGIPYQLVETPVSLRELDRLQKEIEADPGKYDVRAVRFVPRYNQIAAVPNDPEQIDPALQKLAEESRCIQILADAFMLTPRTPDPGVPKDLAEFEVGHTAEGSPFNAVLFPLLNARPGIVAGARKDRNGGGVIYVFDLERAEAITEADAEAKAAYAQLGDKLRIVQAMYSPDDLSVAQVEMMNKLEPLLHGPYYSLHDAVNGTIEFHGEGVSDPAVQKTARAAAAAALQDAYHTEGASLAFTFVDEKVTRAATAADVYDRSYIGGPAVDHYYAGPWIRPPQ